MNTKKILKHVICALAVLLIAGLAAVPSSVKADGLNGMFVGEDNNWHYYVDGSIVNDYTGMAVNDYGWWYFANGQLDFNYTGMACNEYGWWYYTNGQLNTNYTGMACNEYGWWYYTNGQLNTNYTGMACNEYGWWYYNNGQLNTNYTGMACNEYGWWYYVNGRLDTGYTGMACNEYGWWYYVNGQLDTSYTGIGENEYGLWYYAGGRIAFDYSGNILMNSSVYAVTNGRPAILSNTWANVNDKYYYCGNNGTLEQAQGIDVSYHRGAINWNDVKNSGIKFAMIRVGVGDDNISSQDDSCALYNMKECERLGIPYGVYLYSYAVDDKDGTGAEHAASEADHIIRMLQGRNPILGVFLDVEDLDTYTAAGINPYSANGREKITAWTKITLDKISSAGFKAGIYSNQDFYNKILIQSELTSYRWLAAHDKSACPAGEWIIWQYSETGSVPGVSGNVDLDLWMNN